MGDPITKHALEFRGRRLTHLYGKAPKTRGEGRVCAEDGCYTRLSVYNTKEKCHVHRELHYPRLRGRKPREDPEPEPGPVDADGMPFAELSRCVSCGQTFGRGRKPKSGICRSCRS